MRDEGPSGGATVLVVDDNDANRALAQGALEDEGYRVVLAAGGEAGVAAFERERPDCVLLDVRMPEVDGFAACERIRALPGGVETPVIFLTALRDVDTFDCALRAGGDDFLSKPVRPTELLVRVQAALKLRRMSLELREHYALLRRQRDDLLRVQLQKERLMAFVVHDLKNPVNTLDLHAQLLLRNRALPADARDSAEKIRAEARQLNRLILDLLDVSKADEGKLCVRRSEVALGPFVEGILAEFEVAAEARGVHLSSIVAVERTRADEDLLRRVLVNLIENAIRHTPTGGRVAVTVGDTPEGTEFRVADTGAGVPAALHAAIFDPFVQAGSGFELPSSRAGRGLGLAFCKLAAEAHGGRIWLEDGAPGAVFCVRFPRAS